LYIDGVVHVHYYPGVLLFSINYSLADAVLPLSFNFNPVDTTRYVTIHCMYKVYVKSVCNLYNNFSWRNWSWQLECVNYGIFNV